MAGSKRPTSHAEEIRARRSTHTRKAVSNGRARASRSAGLTPPPVMARETLSGLPHLERRKSGKKARRRYDVAFGTQGAEIRLPSLPQVHVGWRLISAALVGMLAFLLYQAWNSPSFRVKSAEIGGLKRLTVDQVSSVVDVADKPVFALNPLAIQRDLEDSFPEFSYVAVHVGLPDTVAITVTERQPVLTWKQGSRTDLVDASGMAFPLREGGQAPAPVVEAADPPPGAAPALDPLAAKTSAAEAPEVGARQLLTPEMVTAILEMADQAPQGTLLLYSAQHGFGWKDARGWEVYFGDASEIENKVHVYKAIVKKLRADDVKPSLISVEFVHAPYYRVEQ